LIKIYVALKRVVVVCPRDVYILSLQRILGVVLVILNGGDPGGV